MVFKIIIPVLLLLGLCFADESAPRERYLHISTNPSGADLYVGDVHPNFSNPFRISSPRIFKIQSWESWHT